MEVSACERNKGEKSHCREPPGRALDIARFGQFDVRRAVPQAVDAEARQCNQEFLLAAVGQVHRQDCMPDLLHDDATTCIESQER